MTSPACSLRVDVPTQTLTLLLDGVERVFPISTSRFGLGFEEGSFKTPTGRFVISEKFGEAAPEGAIFKARVPTGAIAPPESAPEEDLILTRILRLEGCDPENANTRERFIYIHGTNHEDRIGQPASHGCVRMRNKDIIALHALVPIGTPVTIVA